MTTLDTTRLDYLHAHAHPDLPIIMIRGYSGGASAGIDVSAVEARRLAGLLVAAADVLDARTGQVA